MPATNLEEQPDSRSVTSTRGVSSPGKKSTCCTCAPSCDGARGAVITLASFLVHAMTAGFVKSLGVFFVNWQQVFDEGAAAVGWTSSVTAFFALVSGPLAAALARRFGCRPVVIFGGVLAASAFIGASRASSLSLLIGFMVFTGIGLGFTFQPSIIVISFNCKKRLGCALGAASSGIGLGVIAFSPLMRVLIDEYGWQGAMLVLAAVLAHLCVVGALYLPSAQEEMQLRRKHKRQENVRTKNVPKYKEKFQSKRETTFHGETRKTTKEIQVKTDVDVDPSQNAVDFKEHYCLTTNEEDETGMDIGRNAESENNSKTLCAVELREKTWCTGITERTDITVSVVTDSAPSNSFNDVSLDQEVQNVEKSTSSTFIHVRSFELCEDTPSLDEKEIPVVSDESILEVRHENQDLPVPGSSRSRNPKRCCCLLSSLINTFHLSLLVTDFRFTALCVTALFQGVGSSAAFVYTVSRAISIDIPKTEAALLASIMGIGSFAGRLSHGILIDTGMITPLRFQALAFLVESVSCLLLPLTKSFATMSVYAAFFGVSSGIANVLFTINIQRIVTTSKVGSAIGLYLAFQGGGNMLGIFVVGGLSDLTGSYDASYYAAGIVSLVSFSIMMCEPLLKNLQDKLDRRRKKRHQETKKTSNMENDITQGLMQNGQEI